MRGSLAGTYARRPLAFRDENDALRARIATLEGELKSAQSKLESSGSPKAADRLAGWAWLLSNGKEVVDHTNAVLSRRELELVAETIRAEAVESTVVVEERGVSMKSTFSELAVEPKDDHTQIRVGS